MFMKKSMFHLQGVVICVTSLVMALAQDNIDAYVVCYTKAVDRLQKVDITLPAFLLLFSFYSSWLLNTNTQLHMHTTRSLHHGCR